MLRSNQLLSPEKLHNFLTHIQPNDSLNTSTLQHVQTPLHILDLWGKKHSHFLHWASVHLSLATDDKNSVISSSDRVSNRQLEGMLLRLWGHLPLAGRSVKNP